ncbi:uncharacterized protein F4822DRAFT_395320 [Hypoxylon trugodes]|uniref:uncharacterized protein n=1 Tax=Hypoxylon trugodes TaxID=326681 RepID=UPI00219EBC70|nr:uncharacterized protein F4822DRAFT_395320 [Hypoxylon trugodes]KAI1391059.1 hypothetical protein F4822DRAFT_395320 [Hypoxylon trugodes]
MTGWPAGNKTTKTRLVGRQHAVIAVMRFFSGARERKTTRRCTTDQTVAYDQGLTSNSYDSEDDDMYLFDIPMRLLPVLDINHKLEKELSKLIVSTLDIFLSEIWSASDQLHEEGRSRSQIGNSFRTFYGHDGDVEQSLSQNQRSDILGKSLIPLGHHIPCPFYMSNREKHIGCLTRAHLRDIQDVKQHLWNTHQLTPYCPSCGQIFDTMKICNNHIRCRICSPLGVPRPDGITAEQMQQLARRAEPWMSTDLQWLSVWAIVFPRASLPGVTYPSSAIEYLVCLFRDYWSSHGERIMSNFLGRRGLRAYGLQDEERDLEALHIAVLHRVIDHLVEDFKYEDDGTVSSRIERVLASLCHLQV